MTGFNWEKGKFYDQIDEEIERNTKLARRFFYSICVISFIVLGVLGWVAGHFLNKVW